MLQISMIFSRSRVRENSLLSEMTRSILLAVRKSGSLSRTDPRVLMAA